MGRRYKILLICAFSQMFWALPAAAQVEFKGVTASMSGSVAAGYSGDLSGEGGGSDHGMVLGGAGALQGSFYNPNFISFSATPYYNRSQSNSDSQSIFDSSGYSGNINIFSGSRFPGNISFGQDYNTSGLYGIPGTTGLTTKDSNRSFGISWSELVPGLPSASVFFTRGSGSSSLLGSDAQNEVKQDSYGIRSGYRLAGWNLGASFIHQTVDSNTAGLLESGESGEAETTNTSANSYGFNVGHKLPLNGGFGLGVSRTDYSSGYGGNTSGSSNGTTDNAFANLNLQLWRFPITATAAYTDNLQGGFEELLLSNGGTEMQTNLSPESRSLLLNVSTAYHVMPDVTVNGYLSRQEMYLLGQSYGMTQVGANVNFSLGRRFKGLTATIGANDSADQQGNTGATLVANVNYTGNVGHWDFGANFGYDQNVQTMFAIYQTSSMSYGGNLHRRLANGLSWSLGGGGGRTAFEQVAGNGSQAETVNSSLSWHGYTVGADFSQSSGTSVLTPAGLVPVPAPVVSNNLVVYSGQGYGFGFGGSPVRRLSFSVAYSQANSNTLGQSSTSNSVPPNNNSTELTTGLLTYQYRKLYFNASVLQFRQSISASGTPPSRVTSYYFGISRWFKLF